MVNICISLVYSGSKFISKGVIKEEEGDYSKAEEDDPSFTKFVKSTTETHKEAAYII
jgi:hypothetical protein